MGCESIDGSIYSTNHPVVTIDRSQANSLNCVYLYNTEKKESGWNNSSATANALRVLKDQAQVAGGNAVIIRDIYSSEEYREGCISCIYFLSCFCKYLISIRICCVDIFSTSKVT